MTISTKNVAAYRSLQAPQSANLSRAATPTRSALPGIGPAVDTSRLSDGLSAEFIQRALTTEVGKQVQAMLDTQGIDVASLAGRDFSPEAVAERVFDFTTGLQGAFAAQRPEMSGEEARDAFESTLRDAVQSGYQEAMDMLPDIEGVEDVRATAEETMSLLDKLYDAFFAVDEASEAANPTRE